MLVAEDNNDIVAIMILEVIPCHMVLYSAKKVGYIGGGYVEVCYLPENKGSKEAWNGMGYQCFREQARKCIE